MIRGVKFVNLYNITYLFTNSLTYFLTSWNRVLLKKLTGLQLVKKFWQGIQCRVEI
jgi:hypothetical protein